MAAVLAPDSNWGHRLQTAFSQYFEELGGTVVSVQDYSSSSADYSRPIRRLLNLDDSAIRHRRIEDILGEKLEYEPYRRQDVDMIFIAATSRSARGIIPALKFHHASRLPVYATSHVYAGTDDVTLNSDLNGLLFCDMPWVLESTSPDQLRQQTGTIKADISAENISNIHRLKKSFQYNWPGQQRYTRLFALGVDAYHLVFNLEYLHSNPYARFSGTTGNIQLDENAHMVRDLLWARFIKGKATLIKPVLKFDLPAIDAKATPGLVPQTQHKQPPQG